MCPRCRTGLLTQRPPFEHDSEPSYGCVNCGYCFDSLVLENKAKQQKGIVPNERNKQLHKADMGNGSYRVFGAGGTLLGDCGVFNLI